VRAVLLAICMVAVLTGTLGPPLALAESGIRVDGGTLDVGGGRVVAEKVSVAASAKLVGRGTVEGDTTVAGTVSPGELAATSADTLSFSGTLTFLPGSVFNCYVASHVLSDMISGPMISGDCEVRVTKAAGAVPLDKMIVQGSAGSVFDGFSVGGGNPEDWELESVLLNLHLTDLVGDSDGDGLPDVFERDFYGNRTSALPKEDDDADKMTNEEEYIAGTNPRDPESVFEVTAIEVTGGAKPEVKWSSVAGRLYKLERAPVLAPAMYSVVVSNLPATPPENSHEIEPGDAEKYFYRVKVRRQ